MLAMKNKRPPGILTRGFAVISCAPVRRRPVRTPVTKCTRQIPVQPIRYRNPSDNVRSTSAGILCPAASCLCTSFEGVKQTMAHGRRLRGIWGNLFLVRHVESSANKIVRQPPAAGTAGLRFACAPSFAVPHRRLLFSQLSEYIPDLSSLRGIAGLCCSPRVDDLVSGADVCAGDVGRPADPASASLAVRIETHVLYAGRLHAVRAFSDKPPAA